MQFGFDGVVGVGVGVGVDGVGVGVDGVGAGVDGVGVGVDGVGAGVVPPPPHAQQIFEELKSGVSYLFRSCGEESLSL